MPSATEPPPGDVELAEPDRRRLAVSRWALGISVAWLLPLVLVTGVIAYVGLVFVGFLAEGLDGETSTSGVLTVVGIPALALLLAAAAGLGTAAATARGTQLVTALRSVPAWLLGLAAAMLGGVAGVGTFWGTLNTATLLMSD